MLSETCCNSFIQILATIHDWYNTVPNDKIRKTRVFVEAIGPSIANTTDVVCDLLFLGNCSNYDKTGCKEWQEARTKRMARG